MNHMKNFSAWRLLLTLFLVIIPLGAWSQINVRGYVYSNQSNDALEGVRVRNLKSKLEVKTDTLGFYTLKARLGDELEFTHQGFQPLIVKVSKHRVDVSLDPNDPITEPAVIEEIMVLDNLSTETSKRPVSASVLGRHTKETVSYTLEGSASGVFIHPPYEQDNNSFERHRNKGFVATKSSPLSTFSIDTDGASYGVMRQYINSGQLPPADAVRPEEFVNYFTYGYTPPRGNAPIALAYEVSAAPWNTQHKLVRVGLQARKLDMAQLPPSNLTFLIDVSGSMDGPGRLPLVKQSLRLLVNNLRREDRVSIVSYANGVTVELEPTSGSDKENILSVIDALNASGGTAGSSAIEVAYREARKNFGTNKNNRIILCTDGDFNIGPSSPNALEDLIARERQSGIYLTILGYGMGNLRDDRMQRLAQHGNGNHFYIDNLQEANRALVASFGSTMHTLANDVKVQIEMNPKHVARYRLIGYESRALANEDFTNDARDAGEIGAGHSVTALYEIIPNGVDSPLATEQPLRYQHESQNSSLDGELMNISIRYKPVGTKDNVVEQLNLAVRNAHQAKSTTEQDFVAAVALYAELLRQSPYVGKASYDDVIRLATPALANDPEGYRHEFVRLVSLAKSLAPK